MAPKAKRTVKPVPPHPRWVADGNVRSLARRKAVQLLNGLADELVTPDMGFDGGAETSAAKFRCAHSPRPTYVCLKGCALNLKASPGDSNPSPGAEATAPVAFWGSLNPRLEFKFTPTGEPRA